MVNWVHPLLDRLVQYPTQELPGEFILLHEKIWPIRRESQHYMEWNSQGVEQVIVRGGFNVGLSILKYVAKLISFIYVYQIRLLS